MVKNNTRQLPYGDVTELDIRTFRQLEYLLDSYRKVSGNMSPRVKAKCLMVFAHDYFKLGIEEASDEFMLEISHVCPEYFDGPMAEDMDQNLEFDKMCRDMAEWYSGKFNF